MNEPLADQLTTHRRLICCVLAAEIAEHDIRPVFEQIRMTQELRRRLYDATRDSSAQDLVSIEREGGALLCFVTDAKACFTTALALQRASQAQGDAVALPLRIGISLGVVDTIEAAFGEAYLSGDGRLDAERLMRQGPPCQVSVSRSFFELLCRTAPELASCLQYHGVLADTIDPALGWYRVELAGSRTPSSTTDASLAAMASSHPDPSDTRSWAARAYLNGAAWARWAPLPLLALGVVFALSGGFQRDPPVPKVASVVHDGARKAAAEVPMQPEPVPAASPAPPATVAGSPATTAVRSEPGKLRATASPGNTKSATTGTRPAVRAQAKRTLVEKAHAARPVPSGTIHLVVRPWGDVYVDGRHVGVTPPLKVFRVPSGRRLITIRNDAAPTYRREVTVAPDAKTTLRHDFTCVPTREKPCPLPPRG